MTAMERLTITLPADMAGLVKDAVDDGDYGSASEVIREALRDWKRKRELRLHTLAELKAETGNGMADLKAGRVSEFKLDEIAALGKKLRADRMKASSKKAS
jgi:antitoxin ParD1/3/4